MDLRDLLSQFDSAGEIRRIPVPVNGDFELAAICRREFARESGDALLFEQVGGFPFPVVANLFGSKLRMQQILRTDEQGLAGKLNKMLAEQQGRAAERLRTAASSIGATETTLAPAWRRQAGGSLFDLPALRSWPLETKPYFTLPLVITRHPQTGEQNLGLYRVQVLNQKQAAINIRPGSGAGKHLAAAAEQQLQLPVALVFGGDPALLWLAAAPLPSDCDEYKFFQHLFAEKLPLAKGRTQNLWVPADAEFVVEGIISPGNTCQEGPFGNHTGSYVSREDCPLFQLTSVSWRGQPIMPLTVVGPPPNENIYLAKANEILIREMLRIDIPEIIALQMPELTIFHGTALLQVATLDRKTIRELIAELWKNGPLQKAKLLVFFDEDIDLTDYGQAYWRLINQLDSSRIHQHGNQFAIDATGVDPKQLVVEDRATAELLTRRYNEYGR